MAIRAELRRAARGRHRRARRCLRWHHGGTGGVGVQGLIDTVSIVIFGLWMPTMALALAARGPRTIAATRLRESGYCERLRRSLLATLCASCNPQAPKRAPTPPAARRAACQGHRSAAHITGQGTASRPVRFIQQVHNRIEYDLLARSYESKGRAEQQARAVFSERG